MPAVKYNGSPQILTMLRPTIKLGAAGGKPRPPEGKMFPRGDR